MTLYSPYRNEMIAVTNYGLMRAMIDRGGLSNRQILTVLFRSWGKGLTGKPESREYQDLEVCIIRHIEDIRTQIKHSYHVERHREPKLVDATPESEEGLICQERGESIYSRNPRLEWPKLVKLLPGSLTFHAE